MLGRQIGWVEVLAEEMGVSKDSVALADFETLALLGKGASGSVVQVSPLPSSPPSSSSPPSWQAFGMSGGGWGARALGQVRKKDSGRVYAMKMIAKDKLLSSPPDPRTVSAPLGDGCVCAGPCRSQRPPAACPLSDSDCPAAPRRAGAGALTRGAGRRRGKLGRRRGRRCKSS